MVPDGVSISPHKWNRHPVQCLLLLEDIQFHCTINTIAVINNKSLGATVRLSHKVTVN